MMSRELDAWIAENIMRPHRVTMKGIVYISDPEMAENQLQESLCPHYSFDISWAWQVVEKLRASDVMFSLVSHNNNKENITFEWIAKFEFFTNALYDFVFETHESAPMAICLAAKKLVEARE